MTTNLALYSWSFHHDDEIKQRLRSLKRDLTALAFWHLFEMDRRWIKTLEAGLLDWSPLWRYLPWPARSTAAEPIDRNRPIWREFLDGVVAIVGRYKESGDVERFVGDALPVAEQMYEEQERWEDEHLPAEVPAILHQHADAGWFGCFRYTFGNSHTTIWPDSPVDPLRAEVHIQNHVAPDSPFHDSKRLFTWMSEMVRHIEKHHPELERIGTGSWLNQSDAFLQVYPPSYRATLARTSGDYKAGMGVWGQFITHKLTLNQPRAEILRREHRFACPHLMGTCTIADFREHVARKVVSSA
jgi:hypothetical protein